jgi:transposase
MTGSKRAYSVEFREKAVAYVLEQDKSIAAAARELGVGKSTSGSWVSAARDKGAGGVLSREERDEVRRLKAENRELVMRVELGTVPTPLGRPGILLRSRPPSACSAGRRCRSANRPESSPSGSSTSQRGRCTTAATTSPQRPSRSSWPRTCDRRSGHTVTADPRPTPREGGARGALDNVSQPVRDGPARRPIEWYRLEVARVGLLGWFRAPR